MITQIHGISCFLRSFVGNVVSEDFMKGVWKSVSYWSMIRKAGELVNHPLSAWETPDKDTGPTARYLCLGAGGNHLPGARDPV